MKNAYLFKQTIKEKYQFIASSFIITLFMILFYYIGPQSYENDVSTMYVLMNLALAFYSFICPMALFNHIQNGNSHHLQSIPIKRKQYFLVIYVIGLVIGLSLGLFFNIATILPTLNSAVFFEKTGILMIIFFYYYSAFSLCFWICGNTLFYFVTSAILTCGPFLLYLVANSLLELNIKGYYMGALVDEIMEKLLPITGSFINTTSLFPIYLLVLAAIFFYLNLVACNKRPYELNKTSVLFPIMEKIIKAFGFIIGSSTLYLITRINYIENSVFEAASFLISCLISSYIVELLYKQKAKVLYSMKYGIIYGLVIVGIFSVVSGRIENYIPKNPVSASLSFERNGDSTHDITNKESIECLKDLHRHLVEKENTGQSMDIDYIHISYQLSNHRIVQRRYQLYSYEDIKPYLKNRDIYNCLFKEENEIIHYLQLEDCTIQFDTDYGNVLVLDDPLEKQALAKNIQKAIDDGYLQQNVDLEKVLNSYYGRYYVISPEGKVLVDHAYSMLIYDIISK